MPAMSVSWWINGTKKKPQHFAGKNEGFIPAFAQALGDPFNALRHQLNDGGSGDGERCPQTCPRHTKLGQFVLGSVPSVKSDQRQYGLYQSHDRDLFAHQPSALLFCSMGQQRAFQRRVGVCGARQCGWPPCGQRPDFSARLAAGVRSCVRQS